MIDYAMSYEYLIRRAHQCGRYGVEGANADIYRSYERAALAYEDASAGRPTFSTRSKEELAFKAGEETGAIITYLRTALEKLQTDFEDRFNEEQREGLESCEMALLSSKREDIERVIDKATEISVAAGIYP